MKCICVQTGLVSMAIVYLILTSSPCVTGAGLGLGLHGPWRKLQHHLKMKSIKGHVTVYFPSGNVRDFMWSMMKPFLKSYVCRLCVHYPDRCQGDISYCKVIIRREKRAVDMDISKVFDNISP